MGFFIVGAFILTWVAAFLFYRLSHVEENWESMLRQGGAAD